MSKVKKILLLGSTGSIGVSVCNCVRRHPDKFRLVGLSANNNADMLLLQSAEFKPSHLCAGSLQAVKRIRESSGSGMNIYEGQAGLEEIVSTADYDIMLNALVGAVGFRPTVAALNRNKTVALANKESLVIGGDFIKSLLAKGNGKLLPVDSEHSAIMQCLCGEDISSVESLILTASGGPFRTLKADQFSNITPEQALNHPTWSMGKKITIDAGTLMNKGFEVIEAHYLFNIPYEKIRVVIHPQSIVHSMVEFHDGAIMAQCGVPDMELPIQFALSYPGRLPLISKRLDLIKTGTLQFSEPDFNKFPCLDLCIEAGKKGGTLPAVLNAANEVAVQGFLDGKLRYDQIPHVVGEAMNRHLPVPAFSVDIIEKIDRETRELTIDYLSHTESGK